MHVVYAKEPFPQRVFKSLFLAGPTSRGDGKPWRQDALKILHELGYDGHVFVPEPKEGQWEEDYIQQVEWEDEALNRADVICFWVPRDIKGKMPGFTTNDEWGSWKNSGKVVWGCPKNADNVRYQQHYAKKLGVPISYSLRDTLISTLNQIKEGSVRTDGETTVPLHIWKKPEFQFWYKSQLASGNVLNDLDVEWSFWCGPNRDKLFFYAMKPSIYVTEEQRSKTIETVLFRPDISCVLLYRVVDSTIKIVLVREFRSPVINSESAVYELPGGSTFQPDKTPAQVAAAEVSEEVGLHIGSRRLSYAGAQQMGATLCGYRGHLFVCELTQDELKILEEDKSTHGENDEERTTIHVWTKEQVLSSGDLIDWPMLGMIYKGLSWMRLE